jgi:hypothetical protein
MSPRKTAVAAATPKPPKPSGEKPKAAAKPQSIRVRYIIQRAHEHLGPDGQVAQKDIVATVVRESDSPVWGGELTMTIRSPKLAAAFEPGKEFRVEYEV